MVKPSRNRPSLVQTQKVRVGDFFSDIDRFHEKCNERTFSLLGVCSETLRLVARDAATKRRLTRVLVCGRLLKPIQGHSTKYERAQYCRNPKLCPVCRATLAHKRTANRFDAISPKTTSQVLALVYHYFFVDSYEESISFCRHAMKKLLPAILKTCRQYTANARLSGRVLDVVGAMHLKVPPGRQLMQPHVHAVITLDKDANAAFLTQQLQQLTHRTGAQNAAGPCQSVLASCEHQYYAKIKVDSTSVLTGRPCASRDEMTFVRLRSLQEYVQRFGSRDDPISADLQRSDMMKDADLRTHLACSRCQAEKAEAPCSYVSTTHYLVLPLTGAPFEIPADDRKVAETQMRTEAHLLLQDALNGRLAM